MGKFLVCLVNFMEKLCKFQLKFIEIFRKILKKCEESRKFCKKFEVKLEMFEHLQCDY